MDGDDEPVDLPLSADAKPGWVAFVNAVGREQYERHDEPVVAARSKLEGYAARFALVLHLARYAAGEAGVDPREVDAGSVEGGIVLARWFGREAERVHAVMAESEEDRGRRELCDWIAGKGGAVAPRDLERSFRRYRGNEAAGRALQDLVDAGLGEWVKEPHDGERGRPADPRSKFHAGAGADKNDEEPADVANSVGAAQEV